LDPFFWRPEVQFSGTQMEVSQSNLWTSDRLTSNRLVTADAANTEPMSISFDVNTFWRRLANGALSPVDPRLPSSSRDNIA
jgi:hypothetical protein